MSAHEPFFGAFVICTDEGHEHAKHGLVVLHFPDGGDIGFDDLDEVRRLGAAITRAAEVVEKRLKKREALATVIVGKALAGAAEDINRKG